MADAEKTVQQIIFSVPLRLWAELFGFIVAAGVGYWLIRYIQSMVALLTFRSNSFLSTGDVVRFGTSTGFAYGRLTEVSRRRLTFVMQGKPMVKKYVPTRNWQDLEWNVIEDDFPEILAPPEPPPEPLPPVSEAPAPEPKPSGEEARPPTEPSAKQPAETA